MSRLLVPSHRLSRPRSDLRIPDLPHAAIRDRARRHPDDPVARRMSLGMGFAYVTDPDGSVAWQDDAWAFNALMDEGEKAMLQVFLSETISPVADVGWSSNKWLALVDGGTTAPVETDTLTYMAGGAGARETKVPAASGYNRQQVLNTDWTNDGLIGGDYRFTAAEKTFGPASGATWTITHTALVTHVTAQAAASGKFFMFLAISASTTIAINQSFKYILRWAMS